MEHFDAAMVSASSPLAAVMGDEIALMAVMRLDVVSNQTVWGRHGNNLWYLTAKYTGGGGWEYIPCMVQDE